MSDQLIRTARRASVDPHFLGFALAEYAAEKGMDEQSLAAAIGATPGTLALARLCRMPRTDPAGFREDVGRIAGRFGLSVAALALAARCGHVAIARLELSPDTTESAAPLLAARDRDPEAQGDGG